MRIFVIPITRSQWALHCHPANVTPTRLSRWAQTASEKWNNWAHHPKDSWRGRVHSYGERMMDKIDFKEYFMKEVPTKAEGAMIGQVDIIAPRFLDSSDILKQLRTLAEEREPYHSRWMKLSAYCLPFTALFSLVPFVPNFPMFYNIFRIYSHYKAKHGAHHLAHLLHSGSIEVVNDSGMDQWYNGGAVSQQDTPVVGCESDDGYSTFDGGLDQSSIENGVPLLESPPMVSDEDLAQMAVYFGLPMLEPSVRRARHQIIAALSKERSE
ncbi:hypothetical protein DL89DRAFT_256740 [Linderina pennispora]|uniref:Mitochondrial K+-H+ exchange-related-domain-containing protein n=1 Tax=Linderina pennispora TaxID=61395 RepID=A0A1Y1WB28_9FUNG|nr:uncharacterized protein DL89DRAFT_256740 [Linderina pennispora]ORX70528.1 hypothetical protein DL89DRAFT_256740 [Linderina pennispora]